MLTIIFGALALVSISELGNMRLLDSEQPLKEQVKLNRLYVSLIFPPVFFHYLKQTDNMYYIYFFVISFYCVFYFLSKFTITKKEEELNKSREDAIAALWEECFKKEIKISQEEIDALRKQDPSINSDLMAEALLQEWTKKAEFVKARKKIDKLTKYEKKEKILGYTALISYTIFWFIC